MINYGVLITANNWPSAQWPRGKMEAARTVHPKERDHEGPVIIKKLTLNQLCRGERGGGEL